MGKYFQAVLYIAHIREYPPCRSSIALRYLTRVVSTEIKSNCQVCRALRSHFNLCATEKPSIIPNLVQGRSPENRELKHARF